MIISQEIRACNFCGSENMRFDDKRAEIFCEDCGNILDEKMLWGDIAEETVYIPKKNELLFVMPNELRSLDERALIRAYNDLILIDNTLNLRRYARREVIMDYMKLFKKDFTKKRNRMKILGSLVLIISRRDELPYLDEDVAFACYCREKELIRTAKKVADELKVKIEGKKPWVIVLSVSHSLGLDPEYLVKCSMLCEEIYERKLMRNVRSENIAAASILSVCRKYNKEIDERRLRIRLGISKSTAYRLVSEINKLDLDF